LDTEQVGGALVSVHDLTRPGAEPHDLELSPREAGRLQDADLVVYLGGFQTAVDDGVREVGDRALDVADAAELVAATEADHDHGEEGHDEDEAHDEADHDHEAEGAQAEDGHDEGDAHEGDADHQDEDAAHEADHDHEGEDAAHEDEGDGHDHGEEGHDHDHGGIDPHFWLDPERLGHVAETVRDRLIALDPDHADDYRANTEALLGKLGGLVERYETGLAECRSRELVTTHAAFGYLAKRFDLHQHAITGLSPTEDPSGEQLASAAGFVREHDVTTIWFETLISPRIAEVVADETGAATAVLDPIEGLTDESPGRDYLSIMEANLEALRTGLDCT